MSTISILTLFCYFSSAALIATIILSPSSTQQKTRLSSLLKLLQTWSSKHFRTLLNQLLKLSLLITLLIFTIGLTSLFLERISNRLALFLVALVIIFLIILISYLFIYLLAQIFPRITHKCTSLPSTMILWLLTPITFPFLLVIYKLSLPHEPTPNTATHSRDKELLLKFIEQHKEEINSHLKQQIISLASFPSRKAREIMIPNLDMFCLSESTPIIECIQLLSEQGFSRVPLFNKEERSQISGIILYKDLLEFISKNLSNELNTLLKTTPISILKKQTIFTPEDKQIQEVLFEMQRKKMHITIVVDEYGQTAGLITIEDIIEELIGREIQDESDQDEEILFRQTAPNTYRVQAKMSIVDLDKELQISLPSGEAYETINGYIISQLGAIPKKNTKIHYENIHIKVLTATNRRVTTVEIKHFPPRKTI